MKQLLLALLAGGLLWSQAPVKKSTAQRADGSKQASAPSETGQNPKRWPLREIRIQGVKLLTPQQVVELSGLKVGALAGQVELDAARERVYASGCFDLVSYAFEPAAGGGIVATFEIRDVEQRGSWRLDRLPLDAKAFAARAAKTLQGFGAEIPMTEIYTRRMSELAEAMLKEKGVTETVISKFEAGMKDGIIAVIQPRTPPPNISQVVFVGSRAVPPQELKGRLRMWLWARRGASKCSASFWKTLSERCTIRRDGCAPSSRPSPPNRRRRTRAWWSR